MLICVVFNASQANNNLRIPALNSNEIFIPSFLKTAMSRKLPQLQNKKKRDLLKIEARNDAI